MIYSLGDRRTDFSPLSLNQANIKVGTVAKSDNSKIIVNVVKHSVRDAQEEK